MPYRSTDCLSRCGAPMEYLTIALPSSWLAVNNAASKLEHKSLASSTFATFVSRY
jgi:hypothetical protein